MRGFRVHILVRILICSFGFRTSGLTPRARVWVLGFGFVGSGKFTVWFFLAGRCVLG